MTKEKVTKVVETLQTKADEAKKAEDKIFTPNQVIGVFCDNLPKEQSKSLKSLYGDLLAEFSQESQSKIEIGRTLVKIRELLGENFGKFLTTCVLEALRKSERTVYNYVALAQAATLKFARNKVASDAVFRIWGAEGCFDQVNGELKPVVDKAIKAVGGIPESTDSTYCEQWARQFVNTVDGMVRGTRKAQVGGRNWDAATINERYGRTVKNFRSFITNGGVTATMAIKLLTAILVEAGIEMSASDIKQAVSDAQQALRDKKAKIAEDVSVVPQMPAQPMAA